jgi:LysM repeat protein
MKMLDSQLAYKDSVTQDLTDENIIEASIIEEGTIESDTIEENIIEENTEPQSIETINKEISQYYIVQQGDTLRSICYEIYGDYDYIEKVCLWNDIDDPNNILCGQKLLLR